MTTLTKRKILLVLWLVGGIGLASTYNSCAKAVFSQSLASMMAEIQSTSFMLINKDDVYTNNEHVELSLESPHADEVYISNSPDCASGGNWQPMAKLKNWTLGSKNQETHVYAKFRSVSEGLATECIHDAIIHDDQPPAVSLQQPSLVTKDPAPVFNFMAGDALSGLDKTTCQWPGQTNPVNCSFASSNGNIAEGRYLVKVVAYDRAKNVSQPSVQDILVDRTKPTVTLLSVPPSMSNSTSAAVSFLAQDNLSGIQNTECSWDGNTSYATCTSPITANLAEGGHSIYVRTVDLAGNASDEVSYSFTIDLTAPTVTITASPADVSNSASASFSFTGMDGNMPITVFECSLDGSVFTGCNNPKSYAGLSEGVHKFQVRGRDSVGNMSAPAMRSWVIDTKAPTLTFNQTPNSPTSNTTADYKYTASDSGSGIDKIECSLDGAALVSCPADSMLYANLSAGSHGFTVKATDKAGLSTSISHNFVIDLSPPTLQFTNVPGPISNLATFQFGFQANDNIGVAKVECRLDAQSYAPCNSLTKHLVSGLIEGVHSFSVRAVDTAGNLSAEIIHDWTVDLTAPVISYFQVPPSSSLAGTTVSLGFTATDAGAGVKMVTCTLNGTAHACASGQVLNLANLAVGTYTFVVTAVDNVGNSATDTKVWDIKMPVLQNQTAQVLDNKKVDILVIIDNSGSMAKEQANMGARFANFIQKLNGLDWQIGIITTDVSGNALMKDGRIVELKNMPGQYILTSSMSPGVAQTVFSDTVQMGINGSGQELGFKATIRAITRAFTPSDPTNAPNVQLFRPDAALSVLVVSDSRDDSGTTPEQVISTVQTRWNGNKAFSFHSVVIPQSAYTNPNGTSVDPADPCGIYRESVKYDGREYHRLSSMTGGVQGTACSEDYAAQLSAMGTSTAQLVNSITLTCQPYDSNNDGTLNAADIQVKDASGNLFTNFSVTGNKLTFVSALPVGQYQLLYYCVP